MAYIRTCVQNLGEIRRPVRNNCPSSLIIDSKIVVAFILATLKQIYLAGNMG